MKQCIFSIAILLIFLIQHVNGQFSLGITGGVNNAGLVGDAPPDGKYTSNKGYGFGIIGEYDVAKDVKISLQPMIMQKGANIAYKVPDQDDPKDSISINLDYFTIPVLVKVIANNGKTYVSGGLNIGFSINTKLKAEGQEEVDINNTIKPLDVAVNFGVGVMVPIGKPKIIIEGRYAQGLFNISEPEKELEETSIKPAFRTTGLQLFFGFIYPFGKK